MNYKLVYSRVKRWRIQNPDKIHAQRVVFVEKRAGRLQPLPCDVCSDVHTEAHHADYSKPLAIRWLCKQHHADADVRRRALDKRRNQTPIVDTHPIR